MGKPFNWTRISKERRCGGTFGSFQSRDRRGRRTTKKARELKERQAESCILSQAVLSLRCDFRVCKNRRLVIYE
jgi:hypothetical protein